MIYDGIEMNEELYPLRCPKCDNEELNGDDNCFACGAEVMNRCTNVERDFHGNVEWECETILHGKARYCPKCGGESTYLKQKFLRPWHEVKREHDSEAESPDPIWDEILT